MRNDYIEINGKKFRIEFNWNAISSFIEDNNLSLSSIDELDNLKPSQITSLIFNAIKEGARIENIPFNFNEKDVGASLSLKNISDILVVFNRQVQATNANQPVKKKKLFSLKK
jgi:hypothetical protein